MNELSADLANGFQVAWQTTAAFLPKLLMFLVILVVGWFAARVIARAFDAVLERAGFDRLVERGGIKRALAKTPYDASSLLSKLLFYTVFLFVLQLAFGVFGPNPVSELLTMLIAFLPNVLVAVLIVVIASAVAKAVRETLTPLLAGFSYGEFVAKAASIAIVVIGVFAALSQLRVAPAMVNAMFYAILGVVVGSAIVAIGGGGIVPMRAEWERALGRLRAEAPKVRVQVETPSGSGDYRQAGPERADQPPGKVGSPRG